jgi:hypothetical protein
MLKEKSHVFCFVSPSPGRRAGPCRHLHADRQPRARAIREHGLRSLNYSQNILTAARTLQQINNQITMLQNQAQSLINQAKNLTTVAFPELSAISQTITR